MGMGNGISAAVVPSQRGGETLGASLDPASSEENWTETQSWCLRETGPS